MIKYFLSFLIFLLPFSTSAYSLITKVVDGHRVRIFHIPHDDKYRVVAGASNTGNTLRGIIESFGWVAGVNGAYFSPHDYTGNPDMTNAIRIMNGDGFSYSRYYPDTGINGIFWFMNDGKPVLVQNNIYGDKGIRENYNSGFILELQSGIANFPILLVNGSSIFSKYISWGFITEKMKVKSAKSFICRTANDDIKMGTIEKISMMDVPDFLKRFGCVDAINLDNGGSLAMYDKNKYIIGPGRNIMDAFVIIKKS